MRVMKRSVLVLPASMFLLLGLAATGTPAAWAAVASPARAAQPASGYYGSCGGGGGFHYYGAASSGTGSSGTAANIWTWTKWSVDPSGKNFSNEAVWLSDPNEIQYDLEVGFYSGWLYGSTGNENGWYYTSGMTPYYSKDNGNYVYVQGSTYLPANTYISMDASFSGATDLAIVGGFGSGSYMDKGISGINSYQDKANLTNAEQGEVTDTKTWMGGGSGDSMTLFWVDSGGAQHPWSYLNYCYDPPYWSSSSNDTDYFANGGY